MREKKNFWKGKPLTFLRIGLGLILLVYICLRYLNLRVLAGIEVRWGYLALFIISYLLIVALAAWRWKFILKRLYDVHLPFSNVLFLTYFGQSMALVTPSRTGDFGRTMFLTGVLSRRRTFITILYDKISELAMLGVFATLSFFILRERLISLFALQGHLDPLKIGVVTVVILLALLGAAFLVLRYITPIIKEHLLDYSTLLVVLCLSFVVMGMTMSLYYLVALAVGQKPHFLAFVAVGVLQAVISMVSITPGGIGLREGASVMLIPLVGIDEGLAIIITWLGMLGYSIVPALVGVLAYHYRKGVFTPHAKKNNHPSQTD